MARKKKRSPSVIQRASVYDVERALDAVGSYLTPSRYPSRDGDLFLGIPKVYYDLYADRSPATGRKARGAEDGDYTDAWRAISDEAGSGKRRRLIKAVKQFLDASEELKHALSDVFPLAVVRRLIGHDPRYRKQDRWW